ncbi:MAG: hypothetical protein ACRDJP_07490, partial [Actinomycetota bacterium]
LLTLAAAGCARSSAGTTEELTVVPSGGVVTVISGGERTVLEEATVVDPGSRVLTTDGGRAKIQLPDRATLELAPEAEIALLDSAGAQLVRGSILVRSAAPGTTVRAGETDVQSSNAGSVFRMDRGFSLILAVYRGAAEVLGSGVAPVPALRQATVIPGGEIQSGHRPLQVRPNDPWDAQLLGPAIDLGLELLSLERGLTRQIPRAEGLRAVTQALDGFPRSAINRALGALDAARATVAAVIAQRVAEIDGASVVQALNQIVELQSQGAHWIVVVAQWSLADAARTLLGQLARLTNAIARAVAPRPSPTLSSDSSTGGTSTGTGTGSTQSVTPNQGGADGDRTGGGGPGPDGEPPSTGTEEPPEGGGGDDDGAGGGGEEPTCENDIDCVVEDVLGGGGIGG